VSGEVTPSSFVRIQELSSYERQWRLQIAQDAIKAKTHTLDKQVESNPLISSICKQNHMEKITSSKDSLNSAWVAQKLLGKGRN
jgi:hypothetical protein